METQTVQSYVRVRGIKQQSNEVPDNTIAYVIGGSAATLLAITHIAITMLVVATVGAVYGVRTLIPVYQATKVTEAVTEPQKPKRHYEKRIRVNHYQTNKIIRV